MSSTDFDLHVPHEHVPADSNVVYLRLPPQSAEAEQAVLGGLLLDNAVWEEVADLLRPEDLYAHRHRLIFRAIKELLDDNRPADVVTVFDRLKSRGEEEDAGALAYLNSLAQYIPSAANARRYAEIVREKAVLRRLISASEEIATAATNPAGQSAAAILDAAETKIFQIGDDSSRMKQGFQSLDSLMARLGERVQEMAGNRSDVTGVPTGFVDLDRMTAGFQAGDLIVLAARPSMGKTALAVNIAEHVALNEGLPVAVFSMEMGADQLAVRIVGSIGGIDQSHLRTGKLTAEEGPRLADTLDRLRNVSLHIDETPGLTPSELRASARRLARQCGKLGLIVVDYLQLMSVASPGARSREENRATELGEISRGLKALAKELQCPVLALSQLNRLIEQRTDKRPQLSDLRESGAIEQDADVILFISREKDEKSPKYGQAELIIGKQRNGPIGVVRLAFINRITRFESLAAGTPEDY